MQFVSSRTSLEPMERQQHLCARALALHQWLSSCSSVYRVQHLPAYVYAVTCIEIEMDAASTGVRSTQAQNL